ncbi:Protein dispatched-like protein 3 [Bienertia sinuspersici]
MLDSTQWPTFELPTILPPAIKRCAGRPAKQRKRARNEKKKGKRNNIVKCGKCKQVGHNSRTCKGGATKSQQKAAASASQTHPQDNHASASQTQPQNPSQPPIPSQTTAIAASSRKRKSAPTSSGLQKKGKGKA